MDPENDSSDDDSSSPEYVVDPVREAISTINDGNGVDIDAIYEFVKARHDLMPNYREKLQVELNKRVSRHELEMVDNLYKIANTETESETRSSSGEPYDDDMILDAIRKLNEGNGADIDEIYRYIKGKYHVDPDERKPLEDYLNGLVRRNILEMVDNLYMYIGVSAESATEAESKPANTSSDAATSSRDRHLVVGEMVVKALSTLNDGNGADVDEIYGYIKEEGYEIEPQHRELVKEYLDLSVSDNELEMVDTTRYKIVHVTAENTHETTETESKSVEVSDEKDPATSSSDYALPYGDMPEAMVLEAISTIDYGLGVDFDEIYEYIENRYKIPPDYMEILEDELKRRVAENELEKGEYGYKILDVTSENMDESQSKAVAVSDQNVPAKSSSTSAAATSSGNTAHDIVMEAVSTINDGNGVDIDGIHQFLEGNYVLTPNYRKVLEVGLKRRLYQGKLEKVGTQYKILNHTPEKLNELREAAAKAIAVFNQKDFEAREASEAAERAKKVLEENERILQMAKEALDRCTKGG